MPGLTHDNPPLTPALLAGVALRRLLIASLCDQLSNANGFVRRIVLDHSEPPPETRPTTLPPTRSEVQRLSEPTNTTEDLQTVSAMLGGWASDLADLEKLNDDVKFVMDEDMKRTKNAKKNR